MKINKKINKKIIESTTKCTKNFKCLESDSSPYCNVERIVSDDITIVKCLTHFDCTYKVAFADAFVCTCPARIEIFNKYNL